MTDTMGVAETKQRFAELIDRVLDGERFVVTRRGKPVAALVPATADATDDPPSALGLASLAGAMGDWPEFEEVMAEVIASRRHARDRPAPEFE